jgi:hypothetical protein
MGLELRHTTTRIGLLGIAYLMEATFPDVKKKERLKHPFRESCPHASLKTLTCASVSISPKTRVKLEPILRPAQTLWDARRPGGVRPSGNT